MIKGKATLKFKFYEDPSGMQKYVYQPPEPQEELDLQEEDEPPEEENPDALGEAPMNHPVNIGEALVLSPYPGGI